MALVVRLPAAFPHRPRLAALETTRRSTPKGRRACQNFKDSLDQGMLAPDLFEAFCRRLGELMPDPGADCNEEEVLDRIDSPRRFCCQGDGLPAAGPEDLSRVMDVRGYLRARWGKRPGRQAYRAALREWRGRPRGVPGLRGLSLEMRGKRPFFWATPSEAIGAADPGTADRLRDLLGLSHLRRGFLLELCARRVSLPLHAPTVLDALDSPTFYPARGAGGWGVTDDLAGPRPTPGLPEAVAGASRVECDAIPWGDVAPPPRF